MVSIDGEVYADKGDQRYHNRQKLQGNVDRKTFLSLDEAVFRVKERTGGRILSAHQVEDDSGKIFYKIKYLAHKGVVRTIFVDPTVDAGLKKKRRR